MRTELVRIGNSRGIRIPKPLIEQCRLEESVELSVENNRLIISPGRRLRERWADQFEQAGPAENDDLLLEPMKSSEFDRKEWKW